MPTKTAMPLNDLRRVAEQFARLSAAVFDGVLIYDAGVVLNGTRGAAELLGRSEQELQRCRVHELLTQESRITIEQQLGGLQRASCPAMARRSDGSTLPIELSVQASVTIAGRRVHVVALRDASRDESELHLTDRAIARKKTAASLHHVSRN